MSEQVLIPNTVVPEWFQKFADWANKGFRWPKNPFSAEGFACVTDGRVMTAIRGEFGVQEPEDPKKIDGIRNLLTVKGEGSYSLGGLKAFVRGEVPAVCEMCHGKLLVRCPDCKGRKNHICECIECGNEHDVECENCNDDGMADCQCDSKYYPVSAFGVVLNAGLVLKAIEGLPDSTFSVAKVKQKHEESPCIVLIGSDWRTCVMPMRHDGKDLKEFGRLSHVEGE